MKLTWFGGSTFRVHAGGAIVVLAPEDAPAGIDRTELVSGADLVVGGGEVPQPAEGKSWRPRSVPSLLEDEGPRGIEVWSLGDGALVLDTDGEAPLVVISGVVPALGRWVEKGVVVVCGAGQGLVERAGALLDAVGPRLVALAGDEADVDAVFAAVRDRLDGTGLVALERGLAVEV